MSFPQWAKRTVYTLLDAYHRHPPLFRRYVLGEPPPALISLRDAYPTAETDVLAPPCPVSLPNANSGRPRPEGPPDIVPGETPPDVVARLSEATYCSTYHVLLDRDHQIVRESCNASSLRHFRVRRFYDTPRTRIEGPTALWKLRFFNYYHLLIEALPRLLALERTSLLSALGDVQLLCPGGLSSTDAFFLSKLGLDRLPILEVEAGPLYRLESLVLSSLKTEGSTGYLPPWYARTLRERLLPERPSTRRHRLYISRQGAGTRRLANHAAVAKILRRHGFEPVRMEDLCLPEQIELMYDAEAVVAPHGAGLTNLLFGRDLRVLELFPCRKIEPHYLFLSASLGHRYESLPGPGSELNPSQFSVDLSLLDRKVEAMWRGRAERPTHARLHADPS